MDFLIVNNLSELDAFRSEWESLSAEAAEPNVFYERFLLKGALKNLSSQTFKALLIFTAGQKLIGFFPLADKSRYRGLPLKFLGNYEYMHCYLGTPLIRKNWESECFDKFFRWLDFDSRRPFMELRMCSLEGPFSSALTAYAKRAGRKIRVRNRFERAMISSALTPDEYLETVLAKKRRKEIKRLRRRLEEQGESKTEVLAPSGDITQWINDFLKMEESGWKGDTGTALNRDPAQRLFFEETLREAFHSGKLIMLRLSLNGRPIAMQAHFKSGSGSFSFKIAYDEQFGQYSPGVLLEVDLIKYLLSQRTIEWMDSCADANHSMINRLWKQRRAVGHMVIARRSALSTLTVHALSAAHYFYRLFSRRNNDEREAFAI